MPAEFIPRAQPGLSLWRVMNDLPNPFEPFCNQQSTRVAAPFAISLVPTVRQDDTDSRIKSMEEQAHLVVIVSV